MFRLVTICLLSSSILFSCASSYPEHLIASDVKPCVEKFKPVFTSTWYNASIDVVGHHLSGLLLFKQMPDSTLRVVFTNEAGVTFFDYEFSKKGFTVKQSIKQFKRKLVTQTLRKDIELILMNNISPLKSFSLNDELWFASQQGKETNYFITDKNCTQLLRIEKTGKGKKKVEATLHGQLPLAPDSVHLQHLLFNMQINLTKLNR